jgi:hypothetical protein
VKELRQEYPDFFADRRNVLLGVCVDAINPFNSGSVSITPLLLVIYNLPATVSNITCTTHEFAGLCCTIIGVQDHSRLLS